MPPSHQSDDIPILSAFEATKVRMIDVDQHPHLAGPPGVTTRKYMLRTLDVNG